MTVFFSFGVGSVVGRPVERLDRTLDGFWLMVTSILSMVTILIVVMVMVMMVIL